MSDPNYPESCAYHEGGHVVVAAAQGMQLSRHGIHLDAYGRGIAYYKYRKPKRFWDAPQDVEREPTIVATLAGLIAQQKFYPGCSTFGASDDTNLVDMLLKEIEDENGMLGFVESTRVQIDCRQKAERLVDDFWPAIEEIARTLWQTPETPRTFDDPDPSWSTLWLERRLDGFHLIKTLASHGIHTSIWDGKPTLDD